MNPVHPWSHHELLTSHDLRHRSHLMQLIIYLSHAVEYPLYTYTVKNVPRLPRNSSQVYGSVSLPVSASSHKSYSLHNRWSHDSFDIRCLWNVKYSLCGSWSPYQNDSLWSLIHDQCLPQTDRSNVFPQYLPVLFLHHWHWSSFSASYPKYLR